MVSIFSWARGVAAIGLLIAHPAFAQALAADADTWQPCPHALAANDAPSPEKKWALTLAPYAHHWRFNPEHRPVFLGALERQVPGDRFCGLALFRNSFGQPAAYAYVGQQWNHLMGHPELFVKLSAGFIYGYKGKYQNKIPFNEYGIAPVIIPSVGYALSKDDSLQVMVLGTAGLLFSYGRAF
ncbi:MAG: hypothetical protein RLZZ498_189 [Pseudomonadota bacterium]|jgi:hypothetical protein